MSTPKVFHIELANPLPEKAPIDEPRKDAKNKLKSRLNKIYMFNFLIIFSTSYTLMASYTRTTETTANVGRLLIECLLYLALLFNNSSVHCRMRENDHRIVVYIQKF